MTHKVRWFSTKYAAFKAAMLPVNIFNLNSIKSYSHGKPKYLPNLLTVRIMFNAHTQSANVFLWHLLNRILAKIWNKISENILKSEENLRIHLNQ